MERNLRFNAISNCFGRIHDSITKLESIALASSGYETTAPSAPTLLPREDWTDFLCLPLTEPSTGHSVYGRNAMSTWTEKTATTTPVDLETFLSLDPSTPPHASSLLTTPSEDMKIDGLSLPPSPMITDTQSSTP